MNVNITNEFNFLEVHGAINRSGSLTVYMRRAHSLPMGPTGVNSSMNLQKMKFIS